MSHLRTFMEIELKLVWRGAKISWRKKSLELLNASVATLAHFDIIYKFLLQRGHSVTSVLRMGNTFGGSNKLIICVHWKYSKEQMRYFSTILFPHFSSLNWLSHLFQTFWKTNLYLDLKTQMEKRRASTKEQLNSIIANPSRKKGCVDFHFPC